MLNRSCLIMKVLIALIVACSLSGLWGEVALPRLQQSVWSVVNEARKTTVAVEALGSTGSGVVVSADGLVLTAAHVITNLETGEVAETVSILFENGQEFKADVLGTHKQIDAAMLKLRGEGPWVFSTLGNSTTVRPGEWMLALGHPSGYDALRAAPVRFGRVVSKNADYFFGSDCVLFGGDSGGPLFNLKGQVIGIHSWIGEDLQTNTHAGISGFLDSWEKLKIGGEDRSDLVPPPRVRKGQPVIGVMFDGGSRTRNVRLDAVLADSPAEEAGLREGDVLLRVDGAPISAARLRLHLGNLKAGDEVLLDVRRGQKEFLTKVKLDRVSGLPFVTEKGQKILQDQARDFFKAFEDVSSELGNGVVRLFADKKLVGFGTVWEGGLVLAKSSEIEKAKILVGVDSDGREFVLHLREVFTDHDLAVLKLPRGIQLRPISVQGTPARAGTLIAAVRPDGVPEGIGVVSVAKRSLLESARGYLGVGLDREYERGGVFVNEVDEDGAAAEAGVQLADVITAVDGRKINGFEELRTVLSRAGAHQVVQLSVRRRTGPLTLNAKLKPRPVQDSAPIQSERMGDNMDERGLSRVRERFSSVLQTDMTLSPAEMGLPIITSEGRMIGLALARAGRVKTYLLPVTTISELLEK